MLEQERISNMWLVPFKGRNSSGTYEQNFLWTNDNVYIMDNHRAALWCWFQHISEDSKVSLIHIDRHTDTLCSKIDDWVSKCPDLKAITIDDYLGFIYKKQTRLNIPLFRFDNYASIFLAKYNNLIDSCIFVTHKEGDKPNFKHTMQPDVWHLPGNFDCWLEKVESKWICNIDLDYFFYDSDPEQCDELFSDNYIKQLFGSVRRQLDAGKIECLTLSLSPECCGGWKASEMMCQKAVDILGIDFKLPK
jgi:hypothetical protein